MTLIMLGITIGFIAGACTLILAYKLAHKEETRKKLDDLAKFEEAENGRISVAHAIQTAKAKMTRASWPPARANWRP